MQLFLEDKTRFSPWSTGGAKYLPDYPIDSKLFIAIRLRFGDQKDEQIALLDTAAQWPICKKEIADVLGLKGINSLGLSTLSTRFGDITGYLDRCKVTLVSEFGNEIDVDATLFISEDWPGPNVIGWKGCLERIRFAIDPSINIIFYGSYSDGL